MPGELLFEAVSGVWLDTGEALVQHAGQGVDVGSGISRAAGESLWGHVGPAADDRAGSGEFGGRRIVGDAKVDQVDEVTLGHQRVGGFDVAVHQSDGMGGVERGGQLLNYVHGPWRAHRPVALQQLVHVDAVDHRHHQKQPAVDLPGVMDRDDVRLGQPGRGVGLATKALAITRLGAQFGGQTL